MNSNYYISLLTFTPLESDSINLWLETIRKFAPQGVMMSGVVEKKRIKKKEYLHTITLTRDLLPWETEFIVAAWEFLFVDDFEIETSLDYYGIPKDAETEYDIAENVIEELKQSCSKYLHNRWVDTKISEGWRYGLKLNNEQKTHPSLRDWDSLPESYRRAPELKESDLLKFIHKNKSLFG